MEIILDEQDIQSLIKDTYLSVKEVKFNSKDLKVTLKVDSFDFLKTKTRQPQKQEVNIPKKVDPEVKQMEEAKAGIMATGRDEKRRNLIKVG